MNFKKFAALPIGLSLLLSLSAISTASADGMPQPTPPPAVPLDKAIDQIQNKEPPVAVTKPADPAPPIEQTPPPAPVPAARTVEVQPQTSFFGLSIGAYDPRKGGKDAAAFNLEWQPGVHIVGTLQPLFGAMVTTRGSFMGYAGLGVPLHLSQHVFVMPSFAVGAYEKGNGVDLGQVLAFRAGTELAYQFDDNSRLGLNFDAIGNGQSVERTKNRVGIISLVYTTPLNLSGSKNESAITSSPETQAPPPPALPVPPPTATVTAPAAAPAPGSAPPPPPPAASVSPPAASVSSPSPAAPASGVTP